LKKKPDRKLVIATLALLAGAASASVSKGLEGPRSNAFGQPGVLGTLPVIVKKNLSGDS
jgi:hypothetical protein